MPKKNHYAFVIDLSRCIDCRACLVACSVENEVPNEHTRIWVKDLGIQGEYPALSHTFAPYNCMHCDAPPCVEVCVSGATYKDAASGLVLVNREACIGCGYCVEACPYQVRYLNERRGIVDKCNACAQRLEVGLKPACVATCLGGSRMFGDLDDPQDPIHEAIRNAKSVQTLDLAYGEGRETDPNIFYINGDVLHSSIVPDQPKYTLAEEGWKKVLLPLVGAGVGLAFLGQAVMFTRQLLAGESEFDEQ
jgi:tetrathionate reductase subunit B